MRICITGFYGWGNNGDEGILLSIMDSLGDNEYVVCTNLPYTLSENYRKRLPVLEDVRHMYDGRSDYDAFLLGGGGLSWGFGWRQALVALSAEKPSMNYGVGYSTRSMFHKKLMGLYAEFLKQFDAITVRDEQSLQLLRELGVQGALTMCPSINLKGEKFDCPQNMIAVCPRYEDAVSYDHNKPQIDWMFSRLQNVSDEVLLIPFAPYNKEGVPVDLALCRDLAKRLRNAQILDVDGYSPRKIKYAISKSKLVISGGRYHALVWAAAHNVPYEVCPSATENYPKANAFIEMHKKYGNKLKEMELKNKQTFRKVTT